MPLHFLHIQNLSAEWQDGLVEAVAALFGRTAGRVALDEEDFALLGVLVGAVGELPRQSAPGHEVLALHAFAGLAGGYSRRGGQDNFLTYLLGFVGMFLQIVGQSFVHSLLNGPLHLAVAQLRLGLAFKLRLCHLDGDDGGEAFPEVFGGYFDFRLLYLLGDGGVGFGVSLERSGERHAETGEVGAAFYGVDVVDVGVDVLTVVGVVHDGHLDGDTLLLGLQVDDVVEKVGAVAVDEAHELLQTILGMEHFLLGLAFVVGPQVGQGYPNAGIEERQFAHTVGDDVPTIDRGGENRGVGPELLPCSTKLSVAHHFDGIERFALFVLLLVDLSVAEHLRLHVT